MQVPCLRVFRSFPHLVPARVVLTVPVLSQTCMQMAALAGLSVHIARDGGGTVDGRACPASGAAKDGFYPFWYRMVVDSKRGACSTMTRKVQG